MADAPQAQDWQAGGFGLYLHWPFCAAKCPYCDFNSHVAARIDQEEWQAAYLSALDRAAARVPGRVLRSIYFGGGTPSLMAPKTVAAVLDRIARHWRLANDVEITLEANPGSVEADRFAAYAEAGVNRVSIGIQALNDADLRRLGRIHSTAEALRALEIARTSFERVSFDLIYARQDQSLQSWAAELDQALELAGDHLSLYQLTIEPGTVFAARARAGKLHGLPDDDRAADMYELTAERCAAAGFRNYEVSNYAQPGGESRHNLVYWRYGDFIGIGPGAHGRLTLPSGRFATEAPRDPGAWLSAVRQGQEDISFTPIPPLEQGAEMLMMGLRLTEGIDPARYQRLAGRTLDKAARADLAALGLIEERPGKLAVTAHGRLLLNSVTGKLL